MRQRSIALITLIWSRLTCPAFLRRHAGPWSRKISATSNAGRTTAAGRYAGLFTVAAGCALALWAMRVNRFFSSVIRIQTDRRQRVVTTGPYAFVRHPGYPAGILVIVASGPALGSWLAAALVVIFSLPFLLYRTTTEDQILQVELAGYSDYATRVRWRLLPGIW